MCGGSYDSEAQNGGFRVWNMVIFLVPKPCVGCLPGRGRGSSGANRDNLLKDIEIV